MKRRTFLSAATGSALLFPAQSGSLRGYVNSLTRPARPDCSIEVLTGESIGTIAPEIYGFLAEHLGGVVYDGIWVGEHSKVPNVNGIRRSLVEALRRIKPAVVRWPGGCFADSYDWRDGIGPRKDRPRRTNFWQRASEWATNPPPAGPWLFETNQFGTNEFARFCQLIGAQPYLAVNLRALPGKSFNDWVEYCNSPAGSTTLGDLRTAAGARHPFNVRFWGIGNESWGCGGNFTPEEYAAEYRRFTSWAPGNGVELSFIGAGPSDGDLDWTRRFFAKLAERRAFGSMWGWAVHHYSWNVSGGRTSDWKNGKGDAVNYPDEEWYELLREADQMDSIINSQWSAMGEFDQTHRVKLVVDEWGTWYKPGSETHNSHLLGQQSTIRDALVAGITLDTFHRHADKMAMACLAQLVNCLQGLFMAHDDKFALTPTYHVFDLYSAHQRGTSIRTVFSSAPSTYARNGTAATVRGLAGSASLHDRQLILTVTNSDLRAQRETEITIRGAQIKTVAATSLTARDAHEHNDFENPRRIEPKQIPNPQAKNPFVFSFPPASVTRFEITLA